MNMKELLKQHLIAILCVISIIALAFPMITVTSDYSDMSITGFGAIKHSVFALLLIVIPFVLGASTYIKQLEKIRPILSIAAPIFCLLLLILVFFTCKSAASGGANMFGYLGVEVKVGACVIIAVVAYIFLTVLGLKSKSSITIPTVLPGSNVNAAAILENVQTKAAQAAEKVKAAASDMAASHMQGGESTPAKKAVNINRTNEVLGLIEKLSAMKDAGVLTEEEFTQKKQALLEEI